MDAQTIALFVAGGGALGVIVWALAKIGRVLIKMAEALAAAAVVFLTLRLMIKAVAWALRQLLTHWRTSLTLVTLGAWWHWWGPVSLVITVAVVAAVLLGWRLTDLASFDAWAGRHLRAWWLRWTIYAPKLPGWLHACGLGVKHQAVPVVLAVTPLAQAFGRNRRAVAPTERPKVVGVRSGASWDLVRVRLIPGQKPEDFDEATLALACARGVTRCQVRELSPNVVSIDFQRRNLLTEPVPCLDLAAMTEVPGAGVDLRRVWSGRTEYGHDWFVPLTGGPHAGGGGDGGGQELGDVVPAGDHRPGHPRRPGAGVGH